MKNPTTPKEHFINDIQSDKDFQSTKEEGIKSGLGYINPNANNNSLFEVDEEDYEMNQPVNELY